MKVCVTALLGMTLVIFLASPSFTAPSKKGHLVTSVSKLQFFMNQLKSTVTKNKLAVKPTGHQIQPSGQIKGSLEDLNLESFLSYLRWLSAQDAEPLVENVFVTLGDLFDTAANNLNNLTYYFENTVVDLDEVAVEYFDDYLPDLEEFLLRSEDFWRAWIDDPDHIPQNLVIYLPHIQRILKIYGLKTFAFASKVEEFTRIFLTPENLALAQADTERALAEGAVHLQRLKDLLLPPSEDDELPELTVEKVIGLWKYISELNAAAVVAGGVQTVLQLRDLRQQFEADLSLIFLEANGVDLVNAANNITGMLQSALDYRRVQNRLALDNCIYLMYYGDFWEWFGSLVVLRDSVYEGFDQLPDLTVETVEQLLNLVHTTAPEFVERAHVLIQESLDKLSRLLLAYLNIFKPRSF